MINLIKILLSLSINNHIDVYLASIPIVHNKLDRMLQFLSTTYFPAIGHNISKSNSKMNTVNDQYNSQSIKMKSY